MELSAHQQQALDAIKLWIKDPDKQVFYLAGFAGTGKTTMAKEFEILVGGKVLYAAFTGKAALVLREKGCPASTVHKLIYLPAPKSTETLEKLEDQLLELESENSASNPLDLEIEDLKQKIEQENTRAKQPGFALNPKSELRDADLLIVDEVSMVGERMALDLLSYGVKILVLGDPGQLPPVGEAGFFTRKDPDFMLTEVTRQSEGSPVLSMATKVRQGDFLEYGQQGASSVVSRGTLDIAQVAQFDQILVGTNRARHDINRQVREELGFGGHLPQEGDRIVCLRNDYEEGLLNGSQWLVMSSTVVNDDVIRLDIVGEAGGMPQSVTCWRHYFEEREDDLRPWDVRVFQAFDFAYAMTVHKAQGSSWDNVLVIDESSKFRADRFKWLYTALTRAKESVTVVT